MSPKKPRRATPKKRQNVVLNKAEDPLALATMADFTFCFHLAMNDSQVNAYIKAYDVERSTAEAHAFKKANQPWVISSTNKLREKFAKERIESAALSREEILGVCARAVRTPIIEIDEYDPLCIEFKTETTPFGTVKKTTKKMSPLEAMKISSQIQGFDKESQSSASTSIEVLLQKIIIQGIPQEVTERDVTPTK